MVKRSRLHAGRWFRKIKQPLCRYWHGGWWHKIVMGTAIALLVIVASIYGVAQWYIHSEYSQPLQIGVSFSPDYAGSLGVDPQANMDALLGIGVKQFRLVSYWSDMEQTPGQYDFSQLDWQFKKAEASHAKVTLALGLRQPGWPECHMPDWAAKESVSHWQPQLESFMQAVIARYHASPSLQKYEVENEFFLKGFGLCTNFSRPRLISEHNLVQKQDPKHPIIIARSNNALGLPIGQPQPNEFSITVYKRVWDGGFSHRYLEYPFPAWYYAFIAGTQKIFLHKDMGIGELQAEAWAPNGKLLTQISLDEQNKSFNTQRFQDRIRYGKATGMRHIELWGAEYWYYRKQILHDPSIWNVAEHEFQSPQ